MISELYDMEAGRVIEIKGVKWIRIRDYIDKHLEDYWLNTKTGEIIHGSWLTQERWEPSAII
jgi:hypothetical protein